MKKIEIIYVVGAVVLGAVVGLLVKSYNRKYAYSVPVSETEKIEIEVEEPIEVTTSKAVLGLLENVAASVLTEEELTVISDVLYVDMTDDMQVAEYNGEELYDNGLPYAIKINRQENIVTVYSLDEEGYYTVPVKAMRCSVSPIGETPVGLFSIKMKWEWLALFDYCYGQYVSQIEGDTLFHSVPYVDTSKDTLETWEFNKLGTGASLGCVRLCVADTKWIYDNCDPGTQVEIFDSDYFGPLGRPVPVTKLQDTENPGWDPTDMVEENPLTGEAVIYGAESHNIEVGENYDVMAGIWAFDSQRQDVTDKVEVTGQVDNMTAGTYTIKYSFSDETDQVSKTIDITVVDNKAPVVNEYPSTINIESYSGQANKLAQLVASHLTAYEGGVKLTNAVALIGGRTLEGVDVSQIKGNMICVNVDGVKSSPGTYGVTFYVRDEIGNKSDLIPINIIVGK